MPCTLQLWVALRGLMRRSVPAQHCISLASKHTGGSSPASDCTCNKGSCSGKAQSTTSYHLLQATSHPLLQLTFPISSLRETISAHSAGYHLTGLSDTTHPKRGVICIAPCTLYVCLQGPSCVHISEVQGNIRRPLSMCLPSRLRLHHKVCCSRLAITAADANPPTTGPIQNSHRRAGTAS